MKNLYYNQMKKDEYTMKKMKDKCRFESLIEKACENYIDDVKKVKKAPIRKKEKR